MFFFRFFSVIIIVCCQSQHQWKLHLFSHQAHAVGWKEQGLNDRHPEGELWFWPLCYGGKKSPAFSASLFQQFPLDSGLRETICDSKNGFVHHHFVLHWTQSGIKLTLSMFSCHIMYLQAVWGGVLTSSIGFTKRCHSQGLTGSRYPTRPELFFKYPTRPDPKIENDWVPGNWISFGKQ